MGQSRIILLFALVFATDVVWSEDCRCNVSPAVNKQDFEDYAIEQLIPSQFDEPPPPLIIRVDQQTNLLKPGKEFFAEQLLQTPTVQWSCACPEHPCPSGLFTYMVEDTDLLSGQTFMHYLKYNVPCNHLEQGDIAMTYVLSSAIEVNFDNTTIPPSFVNTWPNTKDPDFFHTHLHQVYCQTRQLSRQDFGRYHQTEECSPDLVEARIVTHVQMINILDLVPQPVGVSTLHGKPSEMGNVIICGIRNCVGDTFTLFPSPGFDCSA